MLVFKPERTPPSELVTTSVRSHYLFELPVSVDLHIDSLSPAITAIFIYAAWYCLGWNSVPLTIISEVFTMRFKVMSMTCCLMWQWACTFAVVRFMPVALRNLGAHTYFSESWALRSKSCLSTIFLTVFSSTQSSPRSSDALPSMSSS